ncbi:MAG TPA: prepilin-type N-terminal cleavage/methylation domain-containing protein [Gemmatimonadaceae bacterium]|jgi:prepilin-type N-terminal cleavage/methylation domain-containing protein|nr:prepilin-type N-terminal cleavage/methylation domain-containing protein [Gemmatimonadaceae bacterium]
MLSSAAPDRTARYLTGTRTATAGPAGFTLPEILIVIVMISLLALLAIPRFATANGRRHMESARMRVAAALATARQGAIQKAQTVEFKISQHRVTVNAGTDTLISPVPLDTLYKVRTTQDWTVTFSARGFATNLSSSETYIVLRRDGVPDDTVTVSRTGMVKQ